MNKSLKYYHFNYTCSKEKDPAKWFETIIEERNKDKAIETFWEYMVDSGCNGIHKIIRLQLTDSYGMNTKDIPYE